MLLSWPNSTWANYILFKEKKKKNSLNFHLEMKKIVFQPPLLSFKTLPSKAQHGSIQSSLRTIPRVWENQRKHSHSQRIKWPSSHPAFREKNIWLSGCRGLPFALKDILLYQGIVMTYLRIHTKYHLRETGIPWKHIVWFFFENEKHCKAIQKAKFLQFKPLHWCYMLHGPNMCSML